MRHGPEMAKIFHLGHSLETYAIVVQESSPGVQGTVEEVRETIQSQANEPNMPSKAIEELLKDSKRLLEEVTGIAQFLFPDEVPEASQRRHARVQIAIGVLGLLLATIAIYVAVAVPRNLPPF